MTQPLPAVSRYRDRTTWVAFTHPLRPVAEGSPHGSGSGADREYLVTRMTAQPSNRHVLAKIWERMRYVWVRFLTTAVQALWITSPGFSD